MNTNMQSWQDKTALERFQLISPLLDESLDTKARNDLRQKIASERDISVRTLYRYEHAYALEEFNGLRPMNRAQRRSSKLPSNFDQLLEQAILLKREIPLRSVNQIIYILESLPFAHL